VGWLLDRSGDAVRARVLLDLAPAPLPEPVREEARRIALAHPPALRLALGQQRDGSWPGGLLATPGFDEPEVERAGMIPAVVRLIEYGWPADAPSFLNARRLLYRLLAEDEDPTVLCELRLDATDASRIRASRRRVRYAAGAALAIMGHETDPRVRGVAVRALERTLAWLRSLERLERAPDGTLAFGILSEEAAPPSVHLLVMLAFMPRFRAEQTDALNRILAFVAGPAPVTGARQRVGTQVVAQPYLALGNPLPTTLETNAKQLLPAIAWLEVLARLGALRRPGGPWNALLDRLLDMRDAEGRWPHRVSLPTSDAFVWPIFPLGDPASVAARTSDVTFRLALVARLAGRPLMLR
jgi:hypothetical protein